jgi:hypothetical protein
MNCGPKIERGGCVDFPGLADRAQRREVQGYERKERASGKWSPWEKLAVAEGRMGGDAKSWLRDMHTVHKNRWCVVMVRTLITAIGKVEHAGICTATGTGLTWAEKQKIKDEIFGLDATAIEVFPARANLVDAANMYHLWVLPAGHALPFGIGKADPCSDSHFRP